jgi:hypothetical protein
MSRGALITWREECEAVHGEMDVLLAGGWPETAEERQVRKIQFMALIERRNVAAHNFLKSDRNRAISSLNQQKPSEIPGLSNADPKPEVEIMKAEISQEPSKASGDMARDPQVPPADALLEVRHFLKTLGLQ